MSDRGGWPMFFGFRLSVGASEANEVCVGAVPGPAVIEAMTVDVSAAFVAVRLLKAMGRVSTRLALGASVVTGYEVLSGSVIDSTQQSIREGMIGESSGDRFYPVGITVPDGMWFLVVRADNLGGAAATVSGQIRVEVLGHASLWAEMGTSRVLARHLERGLGGRVVAGDRLAVV